MSCLSHFWWRTLLMLVISHSILAADANGTSLILARAGKSEYRIVVSASAAKSEQRAAAELQKFLREISGATLPIVPDDQPAATKEIILGDNRHLRQGKAPIDVAKLGDDGFSIRTVDDRLLIAGGPNRGTLFGVYTFLEDYLGCRWYSSKVSRIPKRSEVRIGPINSTQVPVLGYREVFYRDMAEAEFAQRLKLNGNTNVDPSESDWGTWCHSFYSFVPPQKYFATHPEYFSLIEGKRVCTFRYGQVEYPAQLCLSNPDVLATTVADLRRRIKERPHARYWSISQMDGHRAACQCPNCQAIDRRKASPMGSILHFVNQVAAEFPDKTIATLAYTYTRRPPKFLRPAKNVAIQLCTIECQRQNAARSIADEPLHADFREDLQRWAKVCENIIIWDYVVQFGSLVSPFPNLRVLQPNLQYFAARHANGVFSQGNREIGGEFSELRAYLLAKLLWNPSCDVNAVMDDFLTGYYGAAAGPIRKYIDLIHDAVEQSGLKLSMDGTPNQHRNGYLSPHKLERYDALFDEAERAVAGERELLHRVQTARLPLAYAQLELGFGDVEDRAEKAKRFFSVAGQNGLQMVSEVDLTLEKYRTRVTQTLEKERKTRPLADSATAAAEKPRPSTANQASENPGQWTHPLVLKGKLNSPLVEVTPFVFKDRLYLLENWQKQWEFPGSPDGSHFQEDEIRIRDVEADKIVSVALTGHGLGMALVWSNRVHVFAGNWGTKKKWEITEIEMTSSDDLVNWTKPIVVLRAEPQEKFFNVSLCRGRESFVLLAESNDPKWRPVTFKYFTSPDLRHWTAVPDAIYGRDKYVGDPALYFEGDWYYTLYLESLGKNQWETRITRSADLVHWQDAPPGRPFVTLNTNNTALPLRPAHLRESNASDAEVVYWKGKTLVYFTGGDQQLAGDLQIAEFKGTPRELFEYFFKPAIQSPESSPAK